MSAKSNLTKLLEQNFNEDELRYLCMDLNIQYESLSGDNKKRKALEIVDYAQRHGQFNLLKEKIAQERPHLQPQLNAIPSRPVAANQDNMSNVNINNNEVDVNVATHPADSFNSRLVVFIAAVIGVSLIIILGAWSVFSQLSSEATDADNTAVPADRFTYQIRIQEKNNNQPIENANVTIDLPGTTPVNKYTDTTGVAVFLIDNQFADNLVVLHIAKDGYEGWDQNITLKANEQPQEIKLEKVP